METLSAALEATLRTASLTPLVPLSPASVLLNDLESQCAAFSAQYEESMWYELEPGEARKYVSANEEVVELQKRLDKLRGDVHREKQLQERLLQSFRERRAGR